MIDNIELNKQLCEEMPYLIPHNVWTGEIVEDYDYSYIIGDYDLPKGWHKLFIQMCKDIRQPLIDDNYFDKFRFSQVKEKYSTMRCYNFGAPQVVHDIIHNYEYVSEYVCQRCGRPATAQTQGYIESLCDQCWKDFGRHEITEFLHFSPIYKMQIYSNGVQSIVEYDCNDIWERLYSV